MTLVLPKKTVQEKPSAMSVFRDKQKQRPTVKNKTIETDESNQDLPEELKSVHL
jgi:hypothetical protein